MQALVNLVLNNGAIYTQDKNRSWAAALAIAGDEIIFVGSDDEVKAFIHSKTQVIDMRGKMLLPGFVEAHAHPSQTMDYVSNISLYFCASAEEYIETIAAYVVSNPNRKDFRGSGWDNSLFPNLGPTKELLDKILPHRPIALVSNDGHSVWVNSVVLEKAGITEDTSNPDGGVIERDALSGEPNGTLRETAENLIKGVISPYSHEERKIALIAYQEMAARAGITLSHDAMLDDDSIETFRSMQEDGSLKIRFRGSITLHPDQDVDTQIQKLIHQRSRNSHPLFQTNAAKIFVDGVIEGGTAFLLEPYKHKPNFRGEPIWKPEQLAATSIALDKLGFQIHVHVIGDAAARITLDAFDHARSANGKRDSRHLITHLHLVNPQDIPRFYELGVVGVPQPLWFAIDDYYYDLALPYLGKTRADMQYPMQSFFDAGVVMASGSDFPVTIPADPLIGIQAGITRSTVHQHSDEVLWPEERASLEDMIASFTINGAYANFLDDVTGSIEVGKQADLVVLERNLFKIPSNEIAKTKVLMTMVAGKEIFSDPSMSGVFQ